MAFQLNLNSKKYEKDHKNQKQKNYKNLKSKCIEPLIFPAEINEQLLMRITTHKKHFTT